MARVLRHKGPEEGLVICPDGWCPLGAFMQVSEMAGWSKEDVMMVVKESFSRDRPRFELKDGDGNSGTLIRATHKRSSYKTTGQKEQRRLPTRAAPPRVTSKGWNNSTTQAATTEAASPSNSASVTESAMDAEHLSPPPVQSVATPQRQPGQTATHDAEDVEPDPFFNGQDPWSKNSTKSAGSKPSCVQAKASKSTPPPLPPGVFRAAPAAAVGAGSGPQRIACTPPAALPPNVLMAPSKPKPPAPPNTPVNPEALAKALQISQGYLSKTESSEAQSTQGNTASSGINGEHAVNSNPVGNCSDLASSVAGTAEATPQHFDMSASDWAGFDEEFFPATCPAPPAGQHPKDVIAKTALAEASKAALAKGAKVPGGIIGESSWDANDARVDLGNELLPDFSTWQQQQQQQRGVQLCSLPSAELLPDKQQQQQRGVQLCSLPSAELLPDNTTSVVPTAVATNHTGDGRTDGNTSAVSSNLPVPVADSAVADMHGACEGGREASVGSSSCKSARSSTGRTWQQYVDPGEGGHWWSTPDSGSWFREDSPQSWVKYEDPNNGQHYWHHEDTGEFFYIPKL
eukprot:CAMPEP_0172788968 /NCGR_PEP_ID=MMETSP1074-20121228/207224_1 /TAXON_ID=2916 /ORGANISM="Ceratium fusus, Strain PA161109" /LENGTH=572 /DNA_ID=CAMNT_0013626003 /DNA_START=38 /DNA_END=1756 /DNA_ORIENTATION=+